jgi:hypothetical protein
MLSAICLIPDKIVPAAMWEKLFSGIEGKPEISGLRVN